MQCFILHARYETKSTQSSPLSLVKYKNKIPLLSVLIYVVYELIWHSITIRNITQYFHIELHL